MPHVRFLIGAMYAHQEPLCGSVSSLHVGWCSDLPYSTKSRSSMWDWHIPTPLREWMAREHTFCSFKKALLHPLQSHGVSSLDLGFATILDFYHRSICGLLWDHACWWPRHVHSALTTPSRHVSTHGGCIHSQEHEVLYAFRWIHTPPQWKLGRTIS